LVEGGENLGIVHFAAHLGFDLNTNCTADKKTNPLTHLYSQSLTGTKLQAWRRR
jgi:hypothetical protein